MQGRDFKDAVYEQFSRVASAFASPKRLEIVDLLVQGPRSVDSIAQQTSMTVTNTSHHLQLLRNAGLVASTRDAQRVVYRIADPSVVDAYRALRQAAEARIAEVRQLAEAFFGEVDGVEPVDMDELLQRADGGDVVVIDVRPAEEFAAGHIAGAVSVPLADLSGRISELPAGATVVAYCRGPYCVLSAEAVRSLRAAGVPARRLPAGVEEWRQAGHRVEAGAA